MMNLLKQSIAVMEKVGIEFGALPHALQQSHGRLSQKIHQMGVQLNSQESAFFGTTAEAMSIRADSIRNASTIVELDECVNDVLSKLLEFQRNLIVFDKRDKVANVAIRIMSDDSRDERRNIIKNSVDAQIQSLAEIVVSYLPVEKVYPSFNAFTAVHAVALEKQERRRGFPQYSIDKFERYADEKYRVRLEMDVCLMRSHKNSTDKFSSIQLLIAKSRTMSDTQASSFSDIISDLHLVIDDGIKSLRLFAKACLETQELLLSCLTDRLILQDCQLAIKFESEYNAKKLKSIERAINTIDTSTPSPMTFTLRYYQRRFASNHNLPSGDHGSLAIDSIMNILFHNISRHLNGAAPDLQALLRRIERMTPQKQANADWDAEHKKQCLENISKKLYLNTPIDKQFLESIGHVESELGQVLQRKVDIYREQSRIRSDIGALVSTATGGAMVGEYARKHAALTAELNSLLKEQESGFVRLEKTYVVVSDQKAAISSFKSQGTVLAPLCASLAKCDTIDAVKRVLFATRDSAGIQHNEAMRNVRVASDALARACKAADDAVCAVKSAKATLDSRKKTLQDFLHVVIQQGTGLDPSRKAQYTAKLRRAEEATNDLVDALKRKHATRLAMIRSRAETVEAEAVEKALSMFVTISKITEHIYLKM